MMRWGAFVHTILLLASVLHSQTYILKFSTDGVDSTTVRSLVSNALLAANPKLAPDLQSQFSIRRLSTPQAIFRSAFPWHQYAVIRFSQRQSVQFLRFISQDPSIDYVQESHTLTIDGVPNDSAYNSQWNLRRIGIASLWENGTINASLPKVKIGVIDTGIDDGHPDLVAGIAVNPGETGNGKESNGIDDDGNCFIDDWKGYDFVDSDTEEQGDWRDRDNTPKDEHGHGTSVAGIIGAQSNNGTGITGILPAQILPLRAFGKNGNGNDIDIASAIVYAADNGAEVINMSFGDAIQSFIIHDAIRYAYTKNVVLIASSGNDGSEYPHYPSDFSEVISIGSINRFDTRSIFSSHSPSLDLMAPGEEIITTTLGGGYTNQFSGTSAAAPHVSGVAALVISLEKGKGSKPGAGFTNEEIRGILMNTADDAGETGWDKNYGAGIVNAGKAIQTVAGSRSIIHSPEMDNIITENSVPIIATAISPYFQSVQLFYGEGENPVQWNPITSETAHMYVKDTLTIWDVSSLQPNIYILRLVMKNSKGMDVEFRQRVIFDPTTPKVLSFHFRDSVIIGSEYGAFVEAVMDRNSTGKLYYRPTGSGPYKVIQSFGSQLHHTFLLQNKDFSPNVHYDIYCDFIEKSSQHRSTKFYLTDSLGFPVTIATQSIATTGFVKKTFSVPKGFLLNSVQSIGGSPSIILNEYSSDNDFGKLKVYNFSNGSFQLKDSSASSWVPRAFIRNNGEGKSMILVQDRGVSQLLQVDTVNGKYFQQPVWGDSSDVWVSQLIDLDGDNRPEIIARSSSEFLVYKNSGNNIFSLQSRLPDPTQPLSGESRNQFGPPRSIVSDFTNSGKKEIFFADYDGDIIMYRQREVNSLQFDTVGTDRTDLFEMSDFLTAGDFSGDGIVDFAVAGHTDMDLNLEREYDLPVWTVRVFSHTPDDAAGTVSKIWDQQFIGVKSGRNFDNGVMSGKLKVNDMKDALFLSLNPQLYIFEWNTLKKTFESKWVHSSQSNSVVVYDFNGDSLNEFGFHSNGTTEFWSLAGTSDPAAPFAVTAIPLSSSKVQLRWNSSATSHTIFKGTVTDSLTAVAVVNGTEWIDSTVLSGRQYFYAVSGSGSLRSSIVSALPHSAPVIDSVIQTSADQLKLRVTYEVASKNLEGTQFLLDGTTTSSSVVWISSRMLL
ncbi:MAG: S8 family peptidase, partial [Bacteroidota bacterium]